MRRWAVLGGVVVLAAVALAGVVAGDGVDVVEAEARAAFEVEYRGGAGDVVKAAADLVRVREEGRKRLARPGVIEVVVHGATLPVTRPVLEVRKGRPGLIEMVPSPAAATQAVVDK